MPIPQPRPLTHMGCGKVVNVTWDTETLKGSQVKEVGENRIKNERNQVQMPIKFRGQEQGQRKRSQRLECRIKRDRITGEQRLEWKRVQA